MTNGEWRMDASIDQQDAADAMKARTKRFALNVIELVESLPKTLASRTIAAQLVRSATSIGANYRAACRARSRAEFVAKMGIVEEEADETVYWLELLAETGIKRDDLIVELTREASELVAIAVASKRTARRNLRRDRVSQDHNRHSKIGNRQ